MRLLYKRLPPFKCIDRLKFLTPYVKKGGRNQGKGLRKTGALIASIKNRSENLSKQLAALLIECKPVLGILSSLSEELVSILWVRLVE